MTAGDVASRWTVGGHRPLLQLNRVLYVQSPPKCFRVRRHTRGRKNVSARTRCATQASFRDTWHLPITGELSFSLATSLLPTAVWSPGCVYSRRTLGR